MRSILAVALSLVASGFTGCSFETIKVTSNPSGCFVHVLEIPGYGTTTPGSLELPVDRNYTLVCEGPDGQKITEVIRWTPVSLLERLGITVVLTPVCGVLGGGLLLAGIYGPSGEALIAGAMLVLATPFIPIIYIFDTGYFDHNLMLSPTEGPERSNVNLRSSIHFNFHPK